MISVFRNVFGSCNLCQEVDGINEALVYADEEIKIDGKDSVLTLTSNEEVGDSTVNLQSTDFDDKNSEDESDTDLGKDKGMRKGGWKKVSDTLIISSSSHSDDVDDLFEKRKSKGSVGCQDQPNFVSRVRNSENEDEDVVLVLDENREVRKEYSPKDFNQIELIGTGFFSKVYLVQSQETKKYYAMKVMKKSSIRRKGASKDIVSEKNLLEKLNHPNIVRLQFAFQDNDFLYLVMTYEQGGELLVHANENRLFDEVRARFYVAEIILALEYLHQRNIIFRDLKLENILIDSKGHIKICDFGAAVELKSKDEKLRRKIGSPEYVSPEMLQCQLFGPNVEGYGKEVDYWALGVLLFELIFGDNPFYSEDENEMYRAILQEEIKFNEDVESSEEIRDFIEKLLIKEPVERLGGGRSGIDEIKAHPFFKGVNWKAMEEQKIKPPFIVELENELDTRYIDQEMLEEALADEEEEGEIEEEEEEFSDVEEKEEFEGFSYS